MYNDSDESLIRSDESLVRSDDSLAYACDAALQNAAGAEGLSCIVIEDLPAKSVCLPAKTNRLELEITIT